MHKNSLDEKLNVWGHRIPEDVRTSVTWVNDTMELAKASAEQVFGDGVSDEIAIKIYDRIIAKIISDKEEL